MKRDILLYGEISPDQYSAGWMSYVLSEVRSDEVHIGINSPGGVVTEAVAMVSLLKASGKRIITHVDGVAASMAFFVAMQGEERYIGRNASAMIHNATGGVSGGADKIRNYGDYVEKINAMYAEEVAAKTGKDYDKIRAEMAAETWFIGQEAVDAGYFTAVEDSEVQSVAAFADTLKGFNPPKGIIPQQKTETTSMLKTELCKAFGLVEADASETGLVERVQALQQKSEMVQTLQSKVDTLESAKAKAESDLKALQEKIQGFEVAELKLKMCKEAGVELADAHTEAFTRRATRMFTATDAAVKADMEADLKAFVKLNGAPIGKDANLDDEARDISGDVELKIQTRAKAIATEKGIGMVEAIKLAAKEISQ